jgi:hypothetical protein
MKFKKNKKFREVAFRVRLRDMSNIPWVRLEHWIELISLIRNKTKEQRLFRFLHLFTFQTPIFIKITTYVFLQ